MAMADAGPWRVRPRACRTVRWPSKDCTLCDITPRGYVGTGPPLRGKAPQGRPQRALMTGPCGALGAGSGALDCDCTSVNISDTAAVICCPKSLTSTKLGNQRQRLVQLGPGMGMGLSRDALERSGGGGVPRVCIPKIGQFFPCPLDPWILCWTLGNRKGLTPLGWGGGGAWRIFLLWSINGNGSATRVRGLVLFAPRAVVPSQAGTGMGGRKREQGLERAADLCIWCWDNVDGRIGNPPSLFKPPPFEEPARACILLHAFIFCWLLFLRPMLLLCSVA